MEEYLILPFSGIAVIEPLKRSVHPFPGDTTVRQVCHKHTSDNGRTSKEKKLFNLYYEPVKSIIGFTTASVFFL